MTATKAYAAASATSPLAPFELQRREPGPRDVEIEIAVRYRFVIDLKSLR